jgi:imidazole glycerol-phosphate synthase subunit HisH
MIAIVDYGMGNLGSIKKKLDKIGLKSIITDSPISINDAENLILPGVGHFTNAVKLLKGKGLWDILQQEVLVHKKPILGICLGMQLMAKHSEEGNTEGFGWFDAEVVRFKISDTLQYKIPHAGWNHVKVVKDFELFNNIDLSAGFYFIHAYHMKCNNEYDILNVTEYEYPFVSAVKKKNIIGLQYHPEKSHETGEQLLKNILNISSLVSD